MFSKYDALSYFLSILINLFFLLLFFSALNFKIPKKREVKVKLVFHSSSSHLVSKSKSITKPKKTKKEKIKKIKKEKKLREHKVIAHKKRVSEKKIVKRKAIPKRVSKKITVKKKAPKNKVYSSEEILREKIAQIKKELAKKKANSKANYALSQSELNELEKKILALQKSLISQKKRKTFKNTSKALKNASYDVFQPAESLGIEYLLLIRRKLQDNFEVPIYLRNQKDLYAVVEMKISSEGKILRYRFLKKSEDSEFNKAVERCLKASSPLPVDKKVKIIVEFKAEGIGKIK